MNNMMVIDQVLILFIIMAIGYFARKRRIITDEVRGGLTELMLDITLPLMTLSSFNQEFSVDKLYNVAYIFMLSFLIHGISFILSKFFYYKYPKDVQGVLRCATVFSNTGFMGFPVLGAVFGKVGVFYASIFNIPFNLILWSVGLGLYTRGNSGWERIKKALLNPTIIATVIGFIMFMVSLKLHEVLNKTFDIVGSATTPLSMMVIGALLADLKIKELFSGFAIFYCSVLRLIVLPAVLLIILKAFGVDKTVMGVAVILFAMPVATMAAIFAEKYNVNATLASKCVFVSTLLSIITIPLVIMMV